MKQYEVRTKDLSGILCPFQYKGQAIKWMDEHPSRKNECVLVDHEWETTEEADRARLDWLDVNRDSNFDFDKWTLIFNARREIRKSIDQIRNAPQPRITVIQSAG